MPTIPARWQGILTVRVGRWGRAGRSLGRVLPKERWG